MNSYDHLFGEVAIQLKLLTREQLARCLNQQRLKPGKRLGEICVALGYLEPGQAQFILEQQAGVKKRRASQMVAAVPPPRRKKRQTLDVLLAGYLDKLTGEQQAVSDQVAEDDPQDARVQPAARKERINRLSKMLARIIVEGSDAAEDDETPPAQQPQQQRVARRAPGPQLHAKPAPGPAPRPASRPKPVLEPELKPGSAPSALEPAAARPPRSDASAEPAATPPPPEVELAAPEWLESTSHELAEPVATPAAGPPGTASAPAPDAAPAPAPASAPAAPALRAHGPVTISAGSLLHRALKAAAEHKASDLHLHSGSPLLLRRDGRLRPLPGESEPLDPERAARIIGEFMGEERWQEFLATREMDLACALPGVGRFRVNAYMQQRGPDVVFRLLPSSPPTLDALGLPQRLATLTQFRTGVVLCTGPTGCGKSTTLAALLDLVVQSRQEHIITIEDPIEFIYTGGKGLVNQRQIGAHTESFARALRAALREDPDVIGITELRDPRDHRPGALRRGDRSPGAGFTAHRQRHADDHADHQRLLGRPAVPGAGDALRVAAGSGLPAARRPR